jgi:hypothetical protein
MDTGTAELQAAYYARIVPILGEGLRQKRIAVVGTAAVAGAVERLAGCRALRWWIADDISLLPNHPLVRYAGATPGEPAGAALVALLRRHNAWETGWDFCQRPTLTEANDAALEAELQAAPPDLLLAGGDAATLHQLAALARRLDIPALLVAHLAGADPAAVCLALLPGDGGQGRDLPDLLAALGHPALADPAALSAEPDAWRAWTQANGVAALLAKAILLHGGPQAAPDLERLLWHEWRTAVVTGARDWPWAIRYVNLAGAGPRPTEIPAALPASCAPPSSALIVGCGSLGSLVARELVASRAVRDLVLVDGDTVAPANPVRQFFHTDQVGQSKAAALARNLTALTAPGGTWNETPMRKGKGLTLTSPAGGIRALAQALTDDRAGQAAFRRLLLARRPAVVVLATCTQVEYALARTARALGIPHVVGRCYPRARYFEAIVVDGQQGPCFGCLRGHLYTGPAPAPTPEEALRYDRPPAPGELQAEPATIVESGRAADVLAGLAGALAAPADARPPWLTALLASEQTCLIGGTSVQRGAQACGATTPAWAYGVQYPGQVVAFGAAQVLGVGAQQVCADCGRQLHVVYDV